jgi:hypothetical protein
MSKRWPKEREELLARCVAEGLTSGETAARIGEGVSRSAVISAARKLKLQWRNAHRGSRRPQRKGLGEGNDARVGHAAPDISRRAHASSKRKSADQNIECGKIAPAVPLLLAGESIEGALWLPLAALTAGQCRFPYGEGDAANYLFCAAPALPVKPYCGCHWSATHYTKVFSRSLREAHLFSCEAA